MLLCDVCCVRVNTGCGLRGVGCVTCVVRGCVVGGCGVMCSMCGMLFGACCGYCR